MKYLPYILLSLLIAIALIAANSQDDGRTYYNVQAFSANVTGQSPTSVANEDLAFNKLGTGNVMLEFPAGAITESVYEDEYIFFNLGGLGTSAGVSNSFETMSTPSGTSPVADSATDTLTWTAGTGVTITGDSAADSITVTNSAPLVVPGNDTEVIFNDGGVLGTDSDLTWDKVTSIFTVSTGGASVSIDGANDTITATGGLLGFGDENLTTTGWLGFTGWDITGSTPTTNYLPYVTGVAGDVATMGWIDPATLDTTHTLDEAYDDGNTINYTGASTEADAIILDATTAADPDYFLVMNYDDVTSYTFGTEGTSNLFRIYSGGGGSNFAFNGQTGGCAFNENQEITGDFDWYSKSHTNAIHADAGADTVSVVGVEFYLGDVDTQTNLVIADGDGEYITFLNDDTITSVSVDIDNIGAWTSGYLVSLNDPSPNEWELIKVDPASLDTNTQTETYAFGTPDPVGGGVNLMSNGVLTLPVAHTGTISRIEVYVGTWTPDGGNIDTLTVTLEYGAIGGTATTTSVSTAGAETTFGTDKSIAITQGHILKVAASAAVSVAPDTIAEITVVITIDI